MQRQILAFPTENSISPAAEYKNGEPNQQRGHLIYRGDARKSSTVDAHIIDGISMCHATVRMQLQNNAVSTTIVRRHKCEQINNKHGQKRSWSQHALHHALTVRTNVDKEYWGTVTLRTALSCRQKTHENVASTCSSTSARSWLIHF